MYQSFNAPSGATAYIGQESASGGSILTGALGYALIVRPLSGKAIQFAKGDASIANMTILNDGNIGIGTASPSAALDLPASTAARASLRIQTGAAPTTPNNGDIWFDGTNIFMRVGGVTKTFTLI